ACGVGEIVLQGNNIRFAPVELRESSSACGTATVPRSSGRVCTVNAGTPSIVVWRMRAAWTGPPETGSIVSA
ncbi:hypothetical protein ACWGJX_27090, partial [Streptomyces sp. NPDC054775]